MGEENREIGKENVTRAVMLVRPPVRSLTSKVAEQGDPMAWDRRYVVKSKLIACGTWWTWLVRCD